MRKFSQATVIESREIYFELGKKLSGPLDRYLDEVALKVQGPDSRFPETFTRFVFHRLNAMQYLDIQKGEDWELDVNYNIECPYVCSTLKDIKKRPDGCILITAIAIPEYIAGVFENSRFKNTLVIAEDKSAYDFWEKMLFDAHYPVRSWKYEKKE